MPPHQTPYVTPHILHKNYAQAHDAESQVNTSEFLSSVISSNGSAHRTVDS